MKRYFKWLPMLLLVVSAGCKKSMSDMYLNANKPTTAPASLSFNYLETKLLDAPGGQNDRTNQYYLQNNSYFGNNEYNLGAGENLYGALTNVLLMEQKASDAGPLNPYEALGKFFKAYFFAKMSLEMGDIPMTQALEGAAQLHPVYDAQKDVFKQVFVWLDSANTDLAALYAKGDNSLTGDIYFSKTNLLQWQKVVNALRIRLLLHLSKKAADADLNVAGQFAAILGNPSKYPLMTSDADNLQYLWLNPLNQYPSNPSTFGTTNQITNSSATYVSLLTKLKDPRVFVTNEPAPGLLKKATGPADFAAYAGADPGEGMSDMSSGAAAGLYSYINRYRYYSTYTGEPTIIIGYAEQEFEIAEGIARGWAGGDAESHYQNGIKTSWKSYNIQLASPLTANYLPSGTGVNGPYAPFTVNVDYNAYYNNPEVKYDAANTSNAITQILQQKYLALFLHSGLESYFTYRRTGVPAFTTGPGTGNSGRIAQRFQYFASDKSANTANYQAVLKQYNGVDDINGKMWILQ